MSEIYAKGIFKGKNGSCGYERGKEYRLIIQHTIGETIIIESPDIIRGQKTPLDKDGYCEYETIISFLKNWSGINEISKSEYHSKPLIIYKNDPPVVN